MKRSGLFTFFLIVLLLAGLSLLLYPTFSDYWNSIHQTRAIVQYSDAVMHLEKEDYSELWQKALDYNQRLLQRKDCFALEEPLLGEYTSQLSLAQNSPIGYIEIPSIAVNLPIYHGVEETVLQVGVGHVDWSSLPTGGENVHCLLSAHRGLPSARLFTDLDQLRNGDLFMIRVLDELLTYEVDRILIVEPHEVETLQVQKGKDLCTLITCTPYGINSHRLLVQGHRVENLEVTQTIRVVADAIVVEPLTVAVILFGPILLVLLIFAFALDRKKKSKYDDYDT